MSEQESPAIVLDISIGLLGRDRVYVIQRGDKYLHSTGEWFFTTYPNFKFESEYGIYETYDEAVSIAKKFGIPLFNEGEG